MPPTDPPPVQFREALSGPVALKAFALVQSATVREANAKYRPWRKVRPIARAAGLDPALVWQAIKIARLGVWQELPLRAADGRVFGMCSFPTLAEQLHHIDHACGGGSVVTLDSPTGLLSDPAARERFIIRTMMEEAIDSSRIEGAVTTRELALELLRSGRAPRTPAEVMVANNYSAMQRVKGWLDRPLSPEFLCELQAILTAGTLKKPDQSGRFRRRDEQVGVVDERTGETVFVPPPAQELGRRISQLCDFANTLHTGQHFLHPLVKASVLHFMIGYEHPFVDGNGRTARAVFYWQALRSGYRGFEYMAISELIRAAYAKYPQAFADTESDDFDLTYFVCYKAGVIQRSIERLLSHLREEEEKIARSLRLVKLDPDLNLRQRLLVEHALRHPRTVYTAKSHSVSNNITAMTARADLEHLRQRGFLNAFKSGREVQYVLASDLPARLKP